MSVVWWSGSYTRNGDTRMTKRQRMSYVGGFYAEDNQEAAKKMSKTRNIGEHDLSPSTSLRVYPLVSDILKNARDVPRAQFLRAKSDSKRYSPTNEEILVHGTTFFSFVYGRSAKGKHRSKLVDEVLGDTGYVHSMIHFIHLHDISFFWWDLMKNSMELELKVPGLLHPDEVKSHREFLAELDTWSEDEYWDSQVL